MAGIMKISIKEATELADLIEENGGNALSLRAAISVTKKSVGLQTIAANEISDEGHVETLREQSPIEHGDGLECMVCHDKFDQLPDNAVIALPRRLNFLANIKGGSPLVVC